MSCQDFSELRSKETYQKLQTVANPIAAIDWRPFKTSDRKRAVLAYIEEHVGATASEVAALLGLSKSRARVILQEMTTDGEIEKIGNNRYTYYKLRY